MVENKKRVNVEDIIRQINYHMPFYLKRNDIIEVRYEGPIRLEDSDVITDYVTIAKLKPSPTKLQADGRLIGSLGNYAAFGSDNLEEVGAHQLTIMVDSTFEVEWFVPSKEQAKRIEGSLRVYLSKEVDKKDENK